VAPSARAHLVLRSKYVTAFVVASYLWVIWLAAWFCLLSCSPNVIQVRSSQGRLSGGPIESSRGSSVILTAAHGIAAADKAATIRFPPSSRYGDHDRDATADYVDWAEDYALLRTPGRTGRPWRSCNATPSRGAVVEAYAAIGDGASSIVIVKISGKVLHITEKHIMLDRVVRKGFSGGPLYWPSRKCVLGIALTRNERDGYSRYLRLTMIKKE